MTIDMKKQYVKLETAFVRLATSGDIAETGLVVASPAKEVKTNDKLPDQSTEEPVWGLAKKHHSVWE